MVCDTKDFMAYRFAEDQAFHLADTFCVRPIDRFANTTVLANCLGDSYELGRTADHYWDGTRSVIEMFISDIAWPAWSIARYLLHELWHVVMIDKLGHPDHYHLDMSWTGGLPIDTMTPAPGSVEYVGRQIELCGERTGTLCDEVTDTAPQPCSVR
jgi:hypothetical protein